MHVIKEIKHDLYDKATREDFRILEKEINFMKTGVHKSISRDEVLKRIDLILAEINPKIDEKVSFKKMKEIVLA